MNHKTGFFSAFILHLFVQFAAASDDEFSFVTDYFLKRQEDDIVAAYGDFNDDKLSDIFLISANASRVDLLLADVRAGTFDRSFTRQTLISRDPQSPQNDSIITSVMLGDFDGDVMMDVLVTRRKISGDVTSAEYNVQIYWGDSENVSLSGPYLFNETLKDEPLIFDVNGDMLPDILGVMRSDGKRYVWRSEGGRHFNRTHQMFADHEEPMAEFHSNAFIDVNVDGSADLIITLEKSFEVWENKDGILEFDQTYKFENKAEIIGQSSFADYDSDSTIDHLVPICEDTDCHQSKIYIYQNSTWHKVMDNFTDDSGKSWGFVPHSSGEYKNVNFTFPVSVRTTDFNLDGYNDIMLILRQVDDAKIQKAFLFYNVPCTSGFCESYGRTFSPVWNSQLSSVNGAVQTSFFDLYDDGAIDVILVSMTDKKPYRPVVNMLRNDLSTDTAFIKILVASGRCDSKTKCPDGRKPYGTNQPGPTVYYKTTKFDGTTQTGRAGQLSQSAHFALQLPYSIFGLGQMPNFVDETTVCLPQPPNTGKRLRRTWPMNIPNSQLIAIPSPIGEPDSWAIKLFLSPSRTIYLTGAALIGTCGFVAGIVGILHWREKREDAVEKKQEAQKFHFDAM